MQKTNSIIKTSTNKRALFIKFEGGDEFNVTDVIPKLDFLSDTYTPEMENTYQEFPGVDGSKYNFSTVGKDDIMLKFWLRFDSYYELKSLRHQVYNLLMQKRLYRLRTNAEPFMVKLCYPKGFSIEPLTDGSNTAEIEVTMENPSGFLFSLKRSNEQDDIWDDYPLGWHIPVFSRNDFTFSTKSFKVYNPSSKEIDPYYDKADLKIMVTFTGKSVKLTNNTTKTAWQYKQSSDNDEEILVDGIVTYVGGQVATNKTDYGNLVLAKGWNDFGVSGADYAEITFSFPFIFL